MAVHIQLRRGNAAAWTAANPLLAEGELGLELDTDKFKFGDGANLWAALPYAGGGTSSGIYNELCPDNGLYYAWVPRLANDGVTIQGEWIASGVPVSTGTAVTSPDNGNHYLWTPRLANDGVTIEGEWVKV